MAIFKTRRNTEANRWEVIAETTEGRCTVAHLTEEFLAEMFVSSLNEALAKCEVEPQEMAELFSIRGAV